MKNRWLLGFGSAALWITCIAICSRALAAHDESTDFPFLEFDHPAIKYEDSTALDAVAKLQQKLDKGLAKLEYDSKYGYLPSVLKNLSISTDTQILVFSKTSFQAPRISPAKPRALFFNDAVAVGSVQNGEVLELVSLDPKLGEVFYTFDVKQAAQPSFHREGIACLQCHYSPATLNVPGILVSSVYPRGDGTPVLSAGSFATDHRIPIVDRWGGWYVTGKQGAARHRGNAIAHDPQDPTNLDSDGAQNLATLDRRFDTVRYLANTSDIVALLTLEHQTRMTNLLIRLGWETRMAEQEGRVDSFQKRLDEIVRETVSYMVFADEAALPEPVEGSSTFAQSFPQKGPRDNQGRSLRDFDLRTRIFRYPVSYMIYGEAFDSLPALAKEQLLRKLYDVLAGNDRSGEFARLSQPARQSALEIVRDTKPNLPAYWTASARQ